MTSKNNANKAKPTNVVPVLYRVEEAAQALRLSRRTVYDLIRCAALRTVKIGARRLVPFSAVVEYANGLEAAA